MGYWSKTSAIIKKIKQIKKRREKKRSKVASDDKPKNLQSFKRKERRERPLQEIDYGQHHLGQLLIIIPLLAKKKRAQTSCH